MPKEEIESKDFARFFGGHQNIMPGFPSWATSYALSIYGEEYYHNCPYKTGNGYGDGRAM